MDYNTIKKLLDQYFEGQTSLEEEEQLRTYFQQENIPDDLKAFQPLFHFFNFEQTQELDQDFDAKVLEQIQLEAENKPTIRRLLPYVRRIAAAVVLALGIAFIAYQYTMPEETQKQAIDWSKYEPQTAEEAFKITKAALLRTSSKLNTGASQAAQEFTKIEEISKFFK